MASDAYFPFGDCVEIAHKEGVDAVIQPGGSVRDHESIDYCNAHGMAMLFTGSAISSTDGASRSGRPQGGSAAFSQ